MDITQIFGYIGALFIGIVLGLIGGGGSILTVPILVYLLAVNPVTATAYSLFVVGVSALVGTLRNIQKGLVDFKTGIVFAIPAFIAVYLTRRFIVPAIPEYLFEIGDFEITKDIGIMIFFAIIMLLASISMIKDRKENNSLQTEPVIFNYPLIIIEGAGVGLLTGIVGAGGGFLIIPALVLMAKLPMKKAVATSLLIIAIKSLIGFIGDIETLTIDWNFLLLFTAISIIGIYLGIWLSNFVEGYKLKKAFGWFVLLMGIYIIIKELT
ncbi:MAG: sulfite exporter TauE/SafE family protein [Bacteroidia bacterium]|nr:sulfite exporter TauE/SafE family protein [Bacteroidia bacterium]NND24742.1 sulfite exporter TauE/SafE family protein [Flavobacteriaceae bacterium]MBT8277837.1 sulfite exporter TauE/SafE family protein [Bacteroidia bacterium]NNK59079.1 sulfite exporter TauE/SafE family protein [Flavobacteriaceae bacterium]NNL31862.1 sulfite exporter TauE/SafE family protein [Flavobacteriaceae bacterium]